MSIENDPFEKSLRELLQQDSASQHDVDAALERVLKTVNRQVGVGALFTLLGRAFYALILGINNGSAHVKPVSRLTHSSDKKQKVD